MATKDGQKTGGRKKGTPNKKTRVLYEALENAGFDPINNLIELYPHMPIELKAKVNLDFIAYSHPKPKAVEASRDGGEVNNILLTDKEKKEITQNIRERMKKMRSDK